MKKQIYFVRHGQTDYNLKRIIQGSGVNSSLNKTGQIQAQAFYDYYKDHGHELVITSKLIRTHETMSHFISGGFPHIETANINEINWGIHEGKPGDAQMKQNYIDLIAHWSNGNIDAAIEEGESARSMMERCTQFLEEIKLRSESKILVCTHGRTLRCLVTLMKNQHPREMENHHHANTGLYLAEWTGTSFEFLKHNDTAHLEGLKIEEA